MLDETWGLKDGEDKETSTPKVKRLNHGPIDDQFKKDFDGVYLTLFMRLHCLFKNQQDRNIFLI